MFLKQETPDMFDCEEKRLVLKEKGKNVNTLRKLSDKFSDTLARMQR